MRRKGRRKFRLPAGEFSERFLTVAEAAEKLKVTPSTIYYYINTDMLEANRDFGIVLVTRDSFERLRKELR